MSDPFGCPPDGLPEFLQKANALIGPLPDGLSTMEIADLLEDFYQSWTSASTRSYEKGRMAWSRYYWDRAEWANYLRNSILAIVDPG